MTQNWVGGEVQDVYGMMGVGKGRVKYDQNMYEILKKLIKMIKRCLMSGWLVASYSTLGFLDRVAGSLLSLIPFLSIGGDCRCDHPELLHMLTHKYFMDLINSLSIIKF